MTQMTNLTTTIFHVVAAVMASALMFAISAGPALASFGGVL
ncbi:MAG: hypothetical protein ACK4MX_06490 [Thermaurantiacus sp.]